MQIVAPILIFVLALPKALIAFIFIFLFSLFWIFFIITFSTIQHYSVPVSLPTARNEGLTNKRSQTDHVITRPMRGLKKIAWEGDKIDTYIQTKLRLLDRIDLVGGCSEKQL